MLQEKYGDRLTFCGSVCVQTTMAWGTVEDVEREVRRRLDLFPKGGLFLGPTHAIQVGSPLENILALYRTRGLARREDRPDDSQRRRRRRRPRQDQLVEAVLVHVSCRSPSPSGRGQGEGIFCPMGVEKRYSLSLQWSFSFFCGHGMNSEMTGFPH